MRLGLIPDTPLERIALWANEAPVPVMQALNGIVVARALMAATRHGLFEALRDGPLSADEVAARASTSPVPTRNLLDFQVALGYLRHDGTRYELTPGAQKWLLAGSPHSLRDALLFKYHEWSMVERLDEHLETGTVVMERHRLGDEGWRLYQRGMQDLSRLSAGELAARIPVPRNATAMLDIGGAHGLVSVAFCRRYPALKATVLDLPEAVTHSAPLLAGHGLGDRVVHLAADALADDLGEGRYDLVLAANFLHLFTWDENVELARRIARALKPGGCYAVVDFARPEAPSGTDQTAAMMNLLFGMTSRSGAWTRDEIAGWQRDAGLQPATPFRLRRGVGTWILLAHKGR